MDEVTGDSEAEIKQGRQQILDKYFPKSGEGTKSRFADPALLF